MQSACVLWEGHVNSSGYGVRYEHGTYVLAHREAYEQHVGPIPEGLLILHSCDTPLCINPDHLRAGTHAENMRDRSARRRHRSQQVTECPQGHQFDEENTMIDNHGWRRCRRCISDKNRRYYMARKMRG